MFGRYNFHYLHASTACQIWKAVSCSSLFIVAYELFFGLYSLYTKKAQAGRHFQNMYTKDLIGDCILTQFSVFSSTFFSELVHSLI